MVKSSCLTYWTDPHDHHGDDIPYIAMRITINPIVSSWEAAAKPEMSALYTGWLRTGFPLFVGYPEIININQPSFLSCIHLSQFLSQYFPASKKKNMKTVYVKNHQIAALHLSPVTSILPLELRGGCKPGRATKGSPRFSSSHGWRSHGDWG